MFGEGQSYYEPLNPSVNELEKEAVNAYMAKVFLWMFAGLFITAITTVAIVVGINTSYAFVNFINTTMQLWIVVVIAQLALVYFISRKVLTMHPTTAKLMYVIYAMSNGLTVGLVAVLIAAQIGGIHVIGVAFGVTAISFGAMAIYGYTTGKDLTSYSSLLIMGVFGLIIASIANWFFGSSMLDFVIIVAGLFIFLVLTAVDTNKIKNHFARVALGGNSDGTIAEGVSVNQEALASNLAIVGALMLYLDFINIFMFILRLLARRR